MRKRILSVALAVGAAFLVSGHIVAQVKVWQGTYELPTCGEDLPDPNPPFDIYATSRFNYPYTLRTGLTGVKAPHVWRAIFLENQYLKCTVLPDIGGHIYTCVDKISGQPMFYANPSIKKAQIGYRGAWAAFGVEFNFPISHNWVSMSPVDFAYRSNSDGSASVWVGNIDRVYGMQWQVELVLRPGSTVLEQHTTLYNRSDLRHRYYWWSNAGLPISNDSRIDYPMQFVASHGFTDIYPWPVGPQGNKDLSVIKNHTIGPVSYFAYGTKEPFMGLWNPETKTGTAHFAQYQDLPGKKIWSWGVDPDGLAWRKALSDNDSGYVEMQAGLFRNQETYAFLDPGQIIHFTEYWMPIRDTGGVTRANLAGIVRLEVKNSAAFVALNVNEQLRGAQISITKNKSVLLDETTDLTPDKTWSRSFPLQEPSAKITFELRDKSGQSLLKQTNNDYDWDSPDSVKTGPQDAIHFPQPANRTDDDWLQLGRNQELNGELIVALATYRDGLSRYPSSQSLTIAAGRLAAVLQQYPDAVRLLSSAQRRDTPNSVIAYYLGVAEDGLGQTRAAETAYEVAYRQDSLRGAAALRLAELQARQDKLPDAAAYLRSAVVTMPTTFRPLEELEAVLRAGGNKDEANNLAQQGLTLQPTSDFLKQEIGRSDVAHLAADPYRVLGVAAEYMRLGLYRNALDVLARNYPAIPPNQSEPGSVLPQNNPLVLYYAAYCNRQLSADNQKNWQAASKLSASYIFPTSETDRIVLEAAVSANAKDATAHFLLGTLLFSKGMTDSGIAQWQIAKQLSPHLPVIDADLGQALLQLKHNSQQAIASFHDGIRNDPDNEALYVGLDEAMSLTGASAAERAEALAAYPAADAAQSRMPADLVYQLALERAEEKEFSSALHLFQGRFFPSQEGGITSAQVVFEIKLLQAKADVANANCTSTEVILRDSQAGSLYEIASARGYVKLAELAQSCNHKNESEELLHKAASSDNPDDSYWAIIANENLGSVDPEQARKSLSALLVAAESRADTRSDSSLWWYQVGVLQQALQDETQAQQSFRKALLLPDSHMSHHLARMAMAHQN